MIFQNSKLLGGKIARIHTPAFTCHVTTAKEGFFQPQSTVVSEAVLLGDTRTHNTRPCAKLIYTPSLRNHERHQYHDLLVDALNAGGEAGISMAEVLTPLFAELRSRGIATEAVNLAPKPSISFREAACHLAARIWDASTALAKQIDDLAKSRATPDVRADTRLFDLTIEYAVVLLHVVDRIAFSKFGAEKRARLIDVAGHVLVDGILTDRVPPATRDGHEQLKDNLIGVLNDRARLYNGCSDLAAQPNAPPKGTVLWEFAKRVSELAGEPKHPAFIAAAIQTFNQALPFLDLEKGLNGIDWA